MSKALFGLLDWLFPVGSASRQEVTETWLDKDKKKDKKRTRRCECTHKRIVMAKMRCMYVLYLRKCHHMLEGRIAALCVCVYVRAQTFVSFCACLPCESFIGPICWVDLLHCPALCPSMFTSINVKYLQTGSCFTGLQTQIIGRHQPLM